MAAGSAGEGAGSNTVSGDLRSLPGRFYYSTLDSRHPHRPSVQPKNHSSLLFRHYSSTCVATPRLGSHASQLWRELLVYEGNKARGPGCGDLLWTRKGPSRE